MNYKEILGFVAILIGSVSYLPYFRDIFKDKTKPHAFSWLIWAILAAIGFAGQISDNAGPGSWTLGLTAIANFSIFLLALRKGEKNILLIDWLCLMGAVIAIIIWFITKEPLLSVSLISVIAILGFFPTFRKSFIKPKEETILTYALNVPKFAFALSALDNLSIVDLFIPPNPSYNEWLTCNYAHS